VDHKNQEQISKMYTFILQTVGQPCMMSFIDLWAVDGCG